MVDDWRRGRKAESKIRKHFGKEFQFYSKARENPLENLGRSHRRCLICTLKNNSEG